MSNTRIGITQTLDFVRPTYVYVDAIVGPSGGGPSGTNKAMASILNPSGSGIVAKLREFQLQAESNSGTNVIVLYELRRITAHAGTAYTPRKRDTSNAASAVEAKSEPTSVTEIADPIIHTLIIQANTSQNLHRLLFGNPGVEPIVLQEGEGLVVHQVTSNGGTFQIQLAWTEETP